MKHDMRPVNHLDTIIELLPGYYAVGSPRVYTTTDAVPFLKGIYSGNGIPDMATWLQYLSRVTPE